MKKIQFYHWYGIMPDVPYKHLEEINYSKKVIMEIIEYLTDKGYWVGLKRNDDTVIIYICPTKFGQK